MGTNLQANRFRGGGGGGYLTNLLEVYGPDPSRYFLQKVAIAGLRLAVQTQFLRKILVGWRNSHLRPYILYSGIEQ